MASYQNTSEYYSGVTMNTHSGHCPNPNVYFNHNPTNYHTHAAAYYPYNYINQEVNSKTFSGGSIYNPTHTQLMYNNGNVCTIQNTPLPEEPVTCPISHKNQNMARKHYAHITILPSSKGNFKAQIKRKRKRTMFTTEQVEALESIFKSKQYVNRDDRLAIVNQLHLEDKAVKIWFQNRRLRVKSMKDSEEQESSNAKTNVEEERIARLNSLELEIIKKTDAYGLVTLDDGLLSNLVSVIDDSLTKTSANIPMEEIGDSDNSSLYEPISPASVIDSNENSSSNWSPSEPDESLKRLFDLQTMLLL